METIEILLNAGTMGIIIISLFLTFIIYIRWYFIKLAVQRGVEDALRNFSFDINNTYENKISSEVVKDGILEALEELDIVEFKYYDENGIQIKIEDNRKNKHNTED